MSIKVRVRCPFWVRGWFGITLIDVGRRHYINLVTRFGVVVLWKWGK